LVQVDRIVGAPPLPIGTPGAEAGQGRVDVWAAVVAARSGRARLTAPPDRG
jgi:hypothetical protein